MEAATANDGLVALLRQVHRAFAEAAEALPSMTQLADFELLEAAELAAGIARLSDAAMVRTVDAVEAQCRRADPEESLAARHGLRDGAALLMTLSGASRRTLTRWRQAGGATLPRGVGSTGVLPPLLPHAAETLAQGTVSLDQVLAIRQHLLESSARAHPDDLDAAERSLVASAVGHAHTDERGECTGGEPCAGGLPLTPELLGMQARAWRDAIDPDGPEPSYEAQRAARSFTLGRRADGMWAGTLLLPPEQGEALRLALDAHNAPRTRSRYEEDEPAGCDEQDGAAPGAGLARRGHLDERSTAQRQADTLVGLITRAMELADAPRIGGDAATVMVTISDAELAEHTRTGAGVAHLASSGEPVPAHVAARIMCDGYLQACVIGEDGLPLKLGRSRRSHTKHQRKAILTAYPGGCQNPGCDAPPGFTEIHHAIWWSHGGTTDTDSGVPLCPHCHTEVHAGRLRCIREAGGRWRVVPSLRLRNRLRLTAA